MLRSVKFNAEPQSRKEKASNGCMLTVLAGAG